MLDIPDASENYCGGFVDELSEFERLCPIADKNVFLSLNSGNGDKICSNYDVCEDRERCRFMNKNTIDLFL